MLGTYRIICQMLNYLFGLSKYVTVIQGLTHTRGIICKVYGN